MQLQSALKKKIHRLNYEKGGKKHHMKMAYSQLHLFDLVNEKSMQSIL